MTRVFVSGCFDLLHEGHLELLEFARRQGDHLIVSIAADATLRALKREPIIGEHARWRMVAALRCVEECFIARGEPTFRDCFSYLANYRPEVWVIDAQDPHREEKLAYAKQLAEDYDLRVVLNHRPEAGLTTSGIIARVKERD